MKELQKLARASSILIALASAPTAHSATPFFDDFEDGNHDGWLVGTPGGTGSTGVESHNASQMAFATHVGSFSHLLSYDFDYSASQNLSFDMQAVAVPSGRGTQAGSGVRVSFLSIFNVGLGTAGLVNVTDESRLGPNDSRIDAVQHHYDVTMGDFASLAGLGPTDQIAKASVSFYAFAESAGDVAGTSQSFSSVWFDNVSVGAVPEPQVYALILAGLGVVGFAARRRKSANA